MELFDEDLFEGDVVDVLNFLEFGIPRQIYNRANHFDSLDEITFRKRFRLFKHCALNVLTQIEHRLEFPYDSNNCVSPMNQLLVCLRFYSTGGHLDTIVDYAGIHVSTASRIVLRVSQAIAELAPQYIALPNNDDDVRKTQQDFYNIASFPRVIGAIDCTHFRIISPGGEDPEIFRNRKKYFSINAQAICNADLKILNIVARWPGSAHDSTIFNNSRVKRDFENNVYRNCLLLGDSGYANKSYLMTPMANPAAPAEHLYNECHIRTRNTVERLFGVLKRRFPVLAYGCRLKLDTFLTIIVAASILHNIALNMGDEEPPPVPEELDEHVLNNLIEDGQVPDINNDPQEGAGALMRRQLIQQYFGRIVE